MVHVDGGAASAHVATRVLLCAAALVLLAACATSAPVSGSDGTTTPATATPATPTGVDLRLNQIQVLGSHNSYHVEPDADVQAAIGAVLPGITDLWQYTHAPLTDQFERSGVRQIEIDVWPDPEGGRWADHHVLAAVGRPVASGDPDLSKPGLKVFHVPELDFKATCATFVRCLEQVHAWSAAHRGRVPITILVEAKDSPTIPDVLHLGFVAPLPFDAAALDEVDREIRSVFADDELITPDDVRGAHATLDEAVRAGQAWPRLSEARGKVLFLLDNADLRQQYARGHPSLQGRVVFTNAQPGEPEAAFVERNDPIANQAEIRSLVQQGYLVRTRADADTKEARSGDTSVRDAALASGAQFVSTDYEVADTRWGHGFVVSIPGGTPARCNPVDAPPGCRPEDVEDPTQLAR
jgi:hypothetical protein